MLNLTAPLLALLSFAGLASQSLPGQIENTRSQLEKQRRALLADAGNLSWMQDGSRATIVRLQIEQNWKQCVENEALALAQASERPARLLAELATNTCRPWQAALELALKNGAYPYVEGPATPGRASREDMVIVTELKARDAAQAKILTWRGIAPAAKATPPQQSAKAVAPGAPRPIPERLAPPDPKETPAPPSTDPAAEMEIVVVAQVSTKCRVRLADRTLSDQELAAKAREWNANKVALKVVRPRRADYRCMAKIARQLGEQGLRFFEFVEASSLKP